MPVIQSDIKYRKAKINSDAITNGGIKGDVEVVSGVRHALFPRVTKAERLAGLTRYRKEFWCNENADDEIAYGVLQWLEYPSNAGDRFYIKEGTQRDTQLGITSPSNGEVPLFTGVGLLNTVLNGGELFITLQMESNDFYFGCGSIIHLSDKIKTSQTMGAGAVIGNSVLYNAGSWGPVTNVQNIIYPYGLYLGSNRVLTAEVTTHEEWLEVADNLTSDEDIGTGAGSSNVVELDTLINVAKGICKSMGKLPVITTLNTSSVLMTAYLNQDGSVNVGLSNASAGQLNMANGVWVTDIVWTSNVKSAEPVLISYRENAFSYSGNLVTIDLETPVSNAYAVANSSASGCVKTDEVVASFDNWVKTSAAGFYDEVTLGNMVVHNVRAMEDDIILTFTSNTLFSLSGTQMGVIGTGYSVAVNCNPTHPVTGLPLFTLKSAGWSGTWAIGDKLQFTIHPSAQAIWLKEVIPAVTDQEPNNLVVMGWYSE